jgi:hypothetical protein
MSLGVTVNNRVAPAPSGSFTDGGTAFVIGSAGAGPTTGPTLVRSLADFSVVYNPRESANQKLYDWLDAFFREGGQKAYVLRYTVGPANVDAALALFARSLGPGQVAAPEETGSAAVYGSLLNHAAANNRFALLDPVLTDNTTALLTTKVGLYTGITLNKDYGMMAGQWVNIPAPAGTIGGSARQVPGSAIVAALCQRVENLGNPNRAAAGRDFPLQYVTSFIFEPTDTERDTLLTAGMNTFATKYGVLEFYGFQTGVVQSPDTPYWQANCSRARMWLTARAQFLGEGSMFKTIDALGHAAEALKGAIIGICLDLYNVDGLFGTDPDDAFQVNVGSAVNTIATIAQGELHAVVQARLSLHAKAVIIDLVSVPVTGQVSAA